MAESLRCFVALDLGPEIRERLSTVIERLRSHGAAVRWVRPAQIHITLVFLGSIASERVDVVRDALGEIELPPPMSLRLAGFGSFPPRGRPRVLWAGLDGDVDAVVELQRRIAARLESLGFPRERRPFRPHVTIGRVKGPRGLEDVMAAMDRIEVPAQSVEVTAFSLYQSTLRPEGAKYDELARFTLPADPRT